MRLNDLDEQAIIAMQIRSLQCRFSNEHEALLNWGAWSRHLAGLYPSLERNHIFDNYIHDEREEWGEEAHRVIFPLVPVKAERAEEETFDEKAAVAFDERLHGAGGLCADLRLCLKAAYVNGGPREGQWHLFANCPTSTAFLERLEACFHFAARFV